MTTVTSTPTTLKSTNPATGDLVGEVPVSTPDEVHAAVARARAALSAWRDLGAPERALVLARVADRIDARCDELAAMITAEMGKPLRAANGEVRGAAESLRHLGPLVEAVEPVELASGELRTRLVRDPLGVVAVITPWNFPVSMAQSMLVPALLVGNTVVAKPSELTPLTGKLLHACYSEALPPAVIELVQGGDAVGKTLVAADVQMVAFVGSQATGRSIMATAARSLKRLVLELGGKDPMVVLEDADLDRAAEFAVHGSLRNSGQVCVSIERVLVHEAIAEEFERRVLEHARKYRVGPGTDADIDMGPMVSAEARQHVLDQLADARSKGAEILLGGDSMAGPGYFLSPAVVRGVTDDMILAHQETFGPVVAIQRVASAEEAIAKANATDYGLGATLWSSDPERATRYAAQLDAGMIGVNKSIGAVPGTPWVGAKQSGLGFTGSAEGIRQFAQTRKISWKAAT
jgi:acyl-CoA reductase-like NAD-dependent aldehyde dehydrogenase